jgi:hypothetical protein
MSFRVQGVYNRSNVNSFPMHSAAKLLLPLLLAPALLPGSAHAFITCNAPLNSCSGTDNNVIFSNFSFSEYTPNPLDRIILSGNSDGSGAVTMVFNPFRSTPTVGSFTYTATLIPAPLFVYNFKDANVDSASVLSSGKTVTATLSSSGLSPAASYSKTGSITAPQVTGIFQPRLTSQTFTQDFNLNPAPTDFVITITHSWTAKGLPVPGPLPLLGAATAFGLSRKLRRRIRSAG